ncbi:MULTISPECIES: type II toxin-antitoxin system CcdA family antitoxin [Gammaproteobacteria]|jgi:antitoxin CcdA|nr:MULTISPECIES: type II toxin-antitoxin system CcdA family antitoxin [Gammaproteobacteria]EBV4791661.1 antitoxin [Salmonella enterica subsp. enterica serovar Litchfield]EIM6092596.1 type II toxin-antitoxin system CcdA family antitoxin [Escherichia coli]EBV4791774.1 antitoxin [Salmonella enterica subsp. enterica serovar Litchfield]EBY7728675.1 antitoxin [Salmonella enterica subsp. enterica serovar Litchfield]EBY7728770.1 antitoxin [Salmonella enterica subsp. enterica serovar Litchfield]
MVTATMRIRSKRTVSVTLEPSLLERARAAGINLSATLATALQHEISGSEAERWKRDNREAIQTLNRMVEERGLFSDDHRTF